MSFARPFAYNTGSTISGTEQLGDLAIGVDDLDYTGGVGGVTWWNGPDEDLGYIICRPNFSGTQPNPVGIPAYVRFLRSKLKTEESFVSLVNTVYGQSFTTGTQCKTYLNNNGYWTSYVALSNLKLHLDASDPNSYSGVGTTWYDLSGNGNDVDMVNSGSITWNNTGAVYFSTGSNGWFNNPSGVDLPTGNSPYTFIIWIQLGANWNSNGFMSIGPFGSGNQANAFRAGSTNQLINYWWGNDLAVNTSVSPTNGWFNAVAKYDGTTRSIWVNGVLVGSDTPVGHNVTTSDLQIAKTYNAEYLNGNIGEALIYDVALSDSDILQYYTDTYPRYISPTPTPTPTITPSITPTSTVTPTVTTTVTPTPTPTMSPTLIVSAFTSVGTTTWVAPAGVTSVQYLVVGGGGGAGNGYDNAGGGGGGAGMVLSGTTSVTPGNTYTVTIGDGGIGGANARANNAGSAGNNSVFGSITALGGGNGLGSRTGGVAGVAQVSNTTSATGGSGSGGGNGGKGGGGSVGNGGSNTGATGGSGGSGISSSITGSVVIYGVGGSGANAGTQNAGVNGTSNTGNGGRAGGATSANSTGGGNGGSGIVVLKYYI